jgi:hypothetical protein
LACAITSGAVCACDGADANCIAVRVVVASSTRRSFVMMVWIPREMFDVWRSTNKGWAGLWRPSNTDLFLFLKKQSPDAPSFIAHSADGFKPNHHLVPAAYRTGSL